MLSFHLHRVNHLNKEWSRSIHGKEKDRDIIEGMHVVAGNPAGGTGCPRHGLPLHHHQRSAGCLHLPDALPPQPAGTTI